MTNHARVDNSERTGISSHERNIRVPRRYEFKCYPTAEQAATLHEQAMMMVDLWNGLLQRHEDIYRRTRGQKGVVHSEARSTYTYFDMTVEFTELRRACPEWAALSVWCGYRVAKSLDLAFQAFFRRAKAGAGGQSGYPRYRRRRAGQSIPHWHNKLPGAKSGGSGCKLTHREGRTFSLSLKGVEGPIHTRGHYPAIPERPSVANVLWHDGRWWFSLCVEMAPRRVPGRYPTTVTFDLIDGFAYVRRGDSDPVLETPADLIRIEALTQQLNAMKSRRDQRWPRPAREDPDWQDADEDIRSLFARIARIRRECLHVWTTRIVRDASDLTIRTPQISEHISTPHGDQREWGASTEIVSELNRSTLSYAPSTAVAMLTYKAEEAGIRCDVVIDEAPAIAIGSAMVQAGQELRRKTRRAKGRSENGKAAASSHPSDRATRG